MVRTASTPPGPSDEAAAVGDHEVGGSARPRRRGADRRADLVRSTVQLIAEQGLDAVTMDAVSARAGVSRPLVYKHFASRDELLAEAYRQEAAELDATIVAAVQRAQGFERKLRAMVGAVLDAEASHGPIFGPLVRAGVRDDAFRRERRARDRRTVGFFAGLAAAELGLDEAHAVPATAILLTGLESVQAQWRARPTAERRQFLEGLYVDLVTAALAGVAERAADADRAD